MAYATAADLIARKDVRSIGDLVQDANTRESADDLLTDANVAQALQDASDDVDAACLVAARYLPADLQGLIDSGGSGAGLLKRLVCSLAFTYLRRRRAYKEGEPEELAEYVEARDTLDKLRSGVLIFGSVQAVIDAGNVVIDPLTFQEQVSQGLYSAISSRMRPARNYPPYTGS